MIAALEKITAIRKQHAKPDCVLITLYPAKQPQWWREGGVVEIVAGDNIARVDLRPLVGCNVVILCDGIDDRVKTLSRTLKGLVASLTVLPTPKKNDDAPESGHAWQRGKGWRTIGARGAA